MHVQIGRQNVHNKVRAYDHILKTNVCACVAFKGKCAHLVCVVFKTALWREKHCNDHSAFSCEETISNTHKKQMKHLFEFSGISCV